MDNHQKDIHTLKTITSQIGGMLNSTIDHRNVKQLSFKINKLTLALAASSHSVAWAEQVYNRRLLQLNENKAWHKHSDASRTALIKLNMRAETYYVTFTERQNKALVTALEALTAMLINVETNE